MGKNLYVGNLSYSVTSAALEEMFAAFGPVVSAQVIEDRETGRSKGFGFVEMGDENAAQQAIQGLNEKEHDGRPLMVNEARPREERGGGGEEVEVAVVAAAVMAAEGVAAGAAVEAAAAVMAAEGVAADEADMAAAGVAAATNATALRRSKSAILRVR